MPHCYNAEMTHSLIRFADAARIRFLGMGFLWSWIYCSWFTSILFPDRTGLVGSNETWLISSTTVTASLFITPCILRRRPALGIPWMLPTAAVLMSFGTLLEADISAFRTFLPEIHIAGGFATGLGCGWLWLMWGEVYARMNTERVEIVAPASALLIPACLILVNALERIAALLFIVALPLLSAASLTLVVFNGDLDPAPVIPPTTNSDQQRIAWNLSRLGIVLAAIYLCSTLINSSVTTADLSVIGSAYQLPTILGAFLAVAISITTVVYSRSLNFFGALRWFLACVAIALVLRAINEPWAIQASCVLYGITRTGVDIMSWIFLSSVARSKSISAALCFGLGRGFIQLGSLIGSILGLFLSSLSPGRANWEFICLVLLCVCTIASAISQGARQGLKARHHEDSLFEKSAAQPQADPSPEEAALTALSEYGLTKRELEVFELLSQGRNIPYIRDALYISRNTVDSHVKSIYRKLDIHSRQELIDLHVSLSGTAPAPDTDHIAPACPSEKPNAPVTN